MTKLGAMENLKVGLNIDIKRSDGRVHEAIITGINPDAKSATVEWFERGETKGKELDFELIFDLNPHLLQKENEAPRPKADVRKSVNRKSVGPSTLHVNGSIAAPPQKTATAAKPAQTAARLTMKAERANDAHNQTIVSPPNGVGKSFALPTTNNDVGADANAASIKRRSNVVDEIEKLKKNREERRAKQEEMRIKKEEAMNVDPGNPNWAFLNMIKEYQAQLDYRPLLVSDATEDHQISVCVRKRPINKKEQTRKEIDVITVPNKDHIIVHEPKTKVDLTKYLENQTFRFDYAFDESSTNEMVYRFTAQPLVKTIFEGGMATCFAYGQTGSGKTHTMGGDFNGKTQDCTKGIYAFTTRDVFKLLTSKQYKSSLYAACSFFEIYSGKVFDLLNAKAKLRVLEDGKGTVQIVGLQEVAVNNEQDVLKLIQRGNEIRTAGQTQTRKLHGKFSLIDLAGNERGADTMSSNRQTRMEGAEINKSLLALKECIRALGRKNAHLPFRASKLTLVLRDSFVGELSRTCMIAMISPGMQSCEHTLNTLRYADRVKELGANPEAALKRDEEDYNFGAQDYPMSDTPVNGNDSDLVLLHSHNDDDFNDEYYNYQMGVSRLQELEDLVVEEHTNLFQELTNSWSKQHQRLVKLTNSVDFDAEGYAQELDVLLDQMIGQFSQLKNNVQTFRKELAQEEELSQTIKRKKK